MSDYMYGPVAGLPGTLVHGTAPWFLQDGCLSEAWPRWVCNAAFGALTSGTLYLVAVPLFEGQVVSTISFMTGGMAYTPGTGVPAWYFALYNSSRVLIEQTADQAAAGWSLNTLKTLPLTENYRVPLSDLYYAGVMIYGGTGVPIMPTLVGAQVTSTALSGLTPILMGSSTTLLTSGTAPSTAGAITSTLTGPWCMIK